MRPATELASLQPVSEPQHFPELALGPQGLTPPSQSRRGVGLACWPGGDSRAQDSATARSSWSGTANPRQDVLPVPRPPDPASSLPCANSAVAPGAVGGSNKRLPRP